MNLILVWIAALAVPQFLPMPLSWHGLLALAVGAGVVQAYRHDRVSAYVLCACLALAYSAWRIDHRLAQQLPAEAEGVVWTVEGRVVDLPVLTRSGQRFLFEVDQVDGGAALPSRLGLSSYGENRFPAGSRWRLAVRLKRPQATYNPHTFDAEGWAFAQGILAKGSVKTATFLGEASGWRAQLDRARAQISQRIQHAVAGQPYAGLMAALVVGEQSAIPAAQWQLFNQTGLTHLVSISGLHLTLVAALVASVVRFAVRRLGVVRIPHRVVAGWAGGLAAVVYAALAGFSVPTQRSLWMILGYVGMISARRTMVASQAWVGSLWCVLMLDPWAVLSLGFWLSFGVVAALFWVGVDRLGGVARWRTWGRGQAAAMIVSAVPLLYGFGQFSWISPVANAWAIPVIGSVITPSLLVAVCLPWEGALPLVHTALAWSLQPVTWLASWPMWQQAAPDRIALGLAALGSVLCLAPAGLAGRSLGGLLMLPLLFPVPTSRTEVGSLRVTVLDVGQGLSVLLETSQHRLLYDTGPSWPGGNVGERVVLPFLRGRGLSSLEGLVLSHHDSDHIGGAAALWPAMPIRNVWTSAPPTAFPEARTTVQPCLAGTAWTWDGVAFQFLHPTPQTQGDDNDRSCVLQVRVGEQTIWLMGDVSARIEANLIAHLNGQRVSVLIASHHGSRTASSWDFLQAAQPSWVVVSAGYRNRYRHPAAPVWQRYQDIGAHRLRTDRDGAVTFVLKGSEIQVQTWRTQSPRYWHRQDAFRAQSQGD